MSLKYLAAYALVGLNNSAPSKAEVEAVLKAGGATVDSSELDFVFTQLQGKDLATLIAEGTKKMSTAAPAAAAGAPAAAAAAAPAAAAGKAPAKAAAKKEESEEEDFGSLF
jgi:large subunit ribosomal protein LP2